MNNTYVMAVRQEDAQKYGLKVLHPARRLPGAAERLRPALQSGGRHGHRDPLTALVDDKHLYPPYYGAYVVRMSNLKAHPEVEKVLDELAGRITDAKMQQMNDLVDEKGESVSKVAHDFLVREGLITG
ncbi:MAG: hypothetical protein K6U79_04225 [Firmicutes bacterium]|nr:hypothetical protein [Bacillota bacterium]